jgi:hypothetical protein
VTGRIKENPEANPDFEQMHSAGGFVGFAA